MVEQKNEVVESERSNITTERVSVVMCTYNGEKFIREQIESILNQTYPLYEFLIFDDVSKDNTISIVKEYADKHSFIKLKVNEQNFGFTKNFEQALRAATGDVIAISDQDDVWMTDKIERMLTVWNKQHPLIYCNSYTFRDALPAKPKEPVFRMFEGTDARKIFMSNTISGHAVIFRKDLLDLVLPFSPDAMYDWWMAVVAAYNGGVQNLGKVLVYHRSHSENSTVDSLNKYTLDERKVVVKRILSKQAKVFVNAPNMPRSHKNFLLEFSKLLEESITVKFHMPLFKFMIKNRHVLYNYKKKRIAIFSHLKHSYRSTLNHHWYQYLNNGG